MLLDEVEDLVDCPRDNSVLLVTAENGMGFSRTCLSVGHDNAIKSIEDIIDNWSRQEVVSLVLALVHVQHVVILELLHVEARPN